MYRLSNDKKFQNHQGDEDRKEEREKAGKK